MINQISRVLFDQYYFSDKLVMIDVGRCLHQVAHDRIGNLEDFFIRLIYELQGIQVPGY
ncbi:MAG: hypothetical protein ABIR36_06830 [Nitrospiraceae bacterium]